MKCVLEWKHKKIHHFLPEIFLKSGRFFYYLNSLTKNIISAKIICRTLTLSTNQKDQERTRKIMINDNINAYIGITDFEDKSQVEAMLTVLREASWGRFVRKLGVGVMMSYKTLNDLPSKFSCVFPRKKW